MKASITILVCLFTSTWAMQSFAQTVSAKIKEINNYREMIDSLHALYDSLRHSLADESQAKLEELKLSESIGEGVFDDQRKNGFETVGGFSVYIFYRHDTISRIAFSGGKNDAYVTKVYYVLNNRPVFSEMTLRQWKDLTNKPYKVVEYYSDKKIIRKKTENLFPKIVDKSIIPNSLFQDGMKYINLELRN
jgi:hypothetical protein